MTRDPFDLFDDPPADPPAKSNVVAAAATIPKSGADYAEPIPAAAITAPAPKADDPYSCWVEGCREFGCCLQGDERRCLPHAWPDFFPGKRGAAVDNSARVLDGAHD